MKIIITLVVAFLIIITYSFGYKKPVTERERVTNTVAQTHSKTSLPVSHTVSVSHNSQDFVTYARSFIGTPYVYASMDPSVGFDCSGFINHVAKHFGMKVPRSSVDFTNIGQTISIEDSRPGDLILFTGTDKTRRVVGHIGIVTENLGGNLNFIHSSSGKAKGVIESEMSNHYQERFMKVVRLTGA